MSSDWKPTEMTSSTWELQWRADQTKSMPDNSLVQKENIRLLDQVSSRINFRTLQ